MYNRITSTRKSSMLAKILSMVREKFREASPQKEADDAQHVIDDPIAEFVLQIDANGDFAIGAECFSTEEKHAPFLGLTLYLLNSGMLADYFIEALRLCSEDDEVKLKFIRSSLELWKDMTEQAIDAEGHSNKDAIDPKDVFSFYAMRP